MKQSEKEKEKKKKGKYEKKYDIFISYRREGGLASARHLWDTLTRYGYRVFFDKESLREGDFESNLRRVLSGRDYSALIYSNPNNPSWMCLSEEELQAIALVADETETIMSEQTPQPAENPSAIRQRITE